MFYHNTNPYLGSLGQLAVGQYKPPTPVYVLPSQKPLPAEMISHPDFQEIFPKIIEHVKASVECYFDSSGKPLIRPPSTQCANAWGYLHAPDPKGFGVPLENHNAILERIKPYVTMPVISPTPTITPPTVTTAVTPTPTKIPVWLIVTLVAGAGIGLYMLLK